MKDTTAASAWWEMTVDLALSGAVDAVGHLAVQWGAQGVEVRDGHGAGGPKVVLHLPEDRWSREDLALLQARLEQLERHFGAPVVREIAIHRVAEQNWAESWKVHYRPVAVGRRILVVPSWLEGQVEDGFDDGRRVPVYIDPGMAFGTGDHVTTRQSLELLDGCLSASPDPGSLRVLDVGTGSGILAMAAALLGAGSVLGLDIDPVAVRVARENVAGRGLGGTIRVEEGDIARLDDGQIASWWPAGHQEEDPRAHLVVSNILLPVLVERAGRLVSLVRPGGRIILAGVTAQQGPRLTEAFRGAGLVREFLHFHEGWVAAVFRRPP